MLEFAIQQNMPIEYKRFYLLDALFVIGVITFDQFKKFDMLGLEQKKQFFDCIVKLSKIIERNNLKPKFDCSNTILYDPTFQNQMIQHKMWDLSPESNNGDFCEISRDFFYTSLGRFNANVINNININLKNKYSPHNNIYRTTINSIKEQLNLSRDIFEYVYDIAKKGYAPIINTIDHFTELCKEKQL